MPPKEKARTPVDLSSLTDTELDELRAAVASELAGRARRPRPASFGMSEGTREELERTGTAVDPFTGERLTGDGK